ncbi:MAG: hypothetical protein JJT82_09270 [Legionellaceae bacterium]|nr:hypothetical protein [Legionellaceae bacterium]
MKPSLKRSGLTLALLLPLPFLLGGCETMGGLFGDSRERHYRTDHRPHDVYEGHQQSSSNPPARSSSGSGGSSNSYSITSQQGRTHHQSANDEGNRDGEPVKPPSVPGTAPQLMD